MTDRRTLDQVVVDALELLAREPRVRLKLPRAKRRLIVGSGNAFAVGRILFRSEDATFADEGSYLDALRRSGRLRNAVVISASGRKDAPAIIRSLQAKGLRPCLITCDPTSSAAGLVEKNRLTVTPSWPEPLTYNTSTYLGMILAGSRAEDPARILQHLSTVVSKVISRDLTKFQAFYLMIQSRFDSHREMFVTKFDELFGGRLTGRAYTPQQTAHAKTVVPWQKELIISFGCESGILYREADKLRIPLFEGAGDAAMLAVGYYVIGHIQRQHPDWFFQNVEAYERRQQRFFQMQGLART